MSATYKVTINGKISNVDANTISRFGLRKQRGQKYFELVATGLDAKTLALLSEIVEGSRETYGEAAISGVWMTVVTETANVAIPAALSDYHARVERGLNKSLTLAALADYTLNNVARLQDAGVLGAESVEMDLVLAPLAGLENAVLTPAEVDALLIRWVAFMPAYKAAGEKFNATRNRR